MDREMLTFKEKYKFYVCNLFHNTLVSNPINTNNIRGCRFSFSLSRGPRVHNQCQAQSSKFRILHSNCHFIKAREAYFTVFDKGACNKENHTITQCDVL